MKGDFEQMLPQVKVREGVGDLIAQIRDKQMVIFVLSSGIDHMVNQLTQLGIPQDHLFANQFLYDASGNYIRRAIRVTGEKKEAFQLIVSSQNILMNTVCYVGDNSFDKELFNFIGDRGGLVILFDSGREKEFRLRIDRDSHHIVHTETLEDVGRMIISRQ